MLAEVEKTFVFSRLTAYEAVRDYPIGINEAVAFLDAINELFRPVERRKRHITAPEIRMAVRASH